MQRVFASVEQLSDTNDPLRNSLDNLFRLILNQELAIFGVTISDINVNELTFYNNPIIPGYYGGFRSEPNLVSYGFHIIAEHHPYDPNSQSYFGLNLTYFLDKVKHFERNMTNNIVPTVKPGFLNKVGLSEDQFIITTTFNIYEYSVSIPPPQPGQSSFIELNFGFRIYFQVEDISSLAPGGLMALKVKFNNLCSDYTVQSIDELRQWVLSLNIPNSSKMTKLQLCNALSSHYKWD